MSPFLYGVAPDDFRDRLAAELERAAVRRKPRINWVKLFAWIGCIVFCAAFWYGLVRLVEAIA